MLNTGTNNERRAASAHPWRAVPSSIWRKARNPASLPSISPAWMPPCMSTTGRPARVCRGRVQSAVSGCDQRQHRPAFGRAAELEAAHLLRPAVVERPGRAARLLRSGRCGGCRIVRRRCGAPCCSTLRRRAGRRSRRARRARRFYDESSAASVYWQARKITVLSLSEAVPFLAQEAVKSCVGGRSPPAGVRLEISRSSGDAVTALQDTGCVLLQPAELAAGMSPAAGGSGQPGPDLESTAARCSPARRRPLPFPAS